MSVCTVDARDRVRKCAATLKTHECVLAVDVLDPHAGPANAWTLECTLDTRGVPAHVLDELGSYRLTLRDASPQGGHWRAVAVA